MTPEKKDPQNSPERVTDSGIAIQPVYRAERLWPAHCHRRIRAAENPPSCLREPAQASPLDAQPCPVGYLLGPQVYHRAAEDGEVGAGHTVSPSARASSPMPSANGRGA